MHFIRYILVLIIILLGISFAALNAESVVVNYYVGSRTLPLSLLLMMILGLGALLGLLTCLGNLVRLKAKNIKLARHVKLLETEINNLRTIPLKDNP